tara:strand:- start:545 stop:1180 length:636 start_codon:yes stop_codon:yes gene_type:complete
MRINDGRSLFGAAALVITGVVLGIIAYPYYQFDEVGEPVKRARWVWEILMNLQVLSLAFMWYCYTDKIKNSEGRRAVLMRVRMVFSLVAVLLPFVVVMTSVMLGWFDQRPPVIDTVRFTYLFSVIGLACVLIPRLVLVGLRLKASRRMRALQQNRVRGFWVFLPGIVAIVLVSLAFTVEYHHLVIWLPALLYGQSSVPYFVSGLCLKKAPE